MAAAEVQALFNALAQLTEQVKAMADLNVNRGTASGGKKWDHPDKYKMMHLFDGDQKNFEEWSVKFRSIAKAGDVEVGRLMECVEADCTEEQLMINKYNELIPDFDKEHEPFIVQSGAEMYNLLLSMTTGDANAVVRRSLGSGWLAWKRLTSTMNPRTLASGIKAISQVLNPPKINQAVKADAILDEWEDKLTKLSTEYSQALTSKMKVAVLYSMLPKDMQEKVLDACTVAWDGTSEGDAGLLYQKVKAQVKNIAKARREMMGPKPMEVDRVTGSWADWSLNEWETEWETNDGDKEEHTHDENEAYVRYIGEKGGGKKGGKGFQGHCYVCGEFGHSQWDCVKGKGKGYGKDGSYMKGYSKGGVKGQEYKGGYKGYKGFGKDGWYKGKGDYSKGGPVTQRACFGCGSTEHLLRDCPKNPAKVQQVMQEEQEEILFIGNVRDDWKHVPMKIGAPSGTRLQRRAEPQLGSQNRFRVLQVDEADDEEHHDATTKVFAVEAEAGEPEWCVDAQGQPNIAEDMGNAKEQVLFVQAVEQGGSVLNLGVGDIVIDSAADESCWPVGQGDAYPTKQSAKQLKLRTANGGEMVHYGEKEILIKYKGGEAKDPIGLKFQVTDVKKPLLAARRLVERGNVVVLSNVDGESYIMNKEAKVRIPVVKKGGSFVVEAQFMKGFGGQA